MGSDRTVRWEALLNARDLGGLPAVTGPIPAGAMVRSDTLFRLAPAGHAQMAAFGIRTVIDMRTPAEAATRPDALADSTVVRYVHLPQQLEEDWRAAGAPHLDRLTFDLAMLDRCGPRIARIVEAIADAPAGGVLYHCEAGKDRTGLLTMLLLDLVGTPHDAIAADYQLTAIGLATLFAELAAVPENAARRARIEEEARCRPEHALAILDRLARRHGGAEAYLLAAGAAAAALERVRARLRASSAT